RAASEDDGRGEGIRAHTHHAIAEFSSHRPSASNRQAGFQHGVEERLPTGAIGALLLRLGLLEGIVDGNGGGWVCLDSKPVHCLRHAVEEKLLSVLLAPVA